MTLKHLSLLLQSIIIASCFSCSSPKGQQVNITDYKQYEGEERFARLSANLNTCHCSTYNRTAVN